MTSRWLMAFAMFLCLSLAFAKRSSELVTVSAHGLRVVSGRAVDLSDASFVLAAGMISGFMSVLTFALYVDSQNALALYQRPTVLWLATPLLLYWVCRLWWFAARGQLGDDPLVFCCRDWVSVALGFLVAVIGVAAK